MLKILLAAVAALLLAGCAIDTRWDPDTPGTRLIQKHSDFLFEVEEPMAKAMGCTGYELCPQVRALLDERMKARRYCTLGYTVNSVGWTHTGQFYALGPCQRAPANRVLRVLAG
jgi:hypothetical protein